MANGNKKGFQPAEGTGIIGRTIVESGGVSRAEDLQRKEKQEEQKQDQQQNQPQPAEGTGIIGRTIVESGGVSRAEDLQKEASQKQRQQQGRQQQQDKAAAQKRRESLEQFARNQGVSQPETQKQRQILETLQRTRDARQYGFTQAERGANLLMQQSIEQAEQVDEAEQQREETGQRFSTAIQQVRSAPADTTFTIGGEELTRNEALEQLREQQEETQEEIDDFIGSAQRKISILEDTAEAREQTDPLDGRTNENVLESLSNTEALKVGALTATQPEGIKFAAAGIRGDEETQKEAVTDIIGKTRTGQLTPGKAAVRSIGSAPGIAASSGLIGGATIKGAGTLVSRGVISGKTASRALKIGGGIVIAGETLNIGSKVAQGKEQEATEEALRFGTGLTGFGLGAKAAGGAAALTGRLSKSPQRTLGDLIPRSQRNIVESQVPTFEQVPGRAALRTGPRQTRAIESQGQRFVPEQLGARETGTGLEKPGAKMERFKPEELELLAQRKGSEFLGRTDEGGAVFKKETGGTRLLKEFEETSLEPPKVFNREQARPGFFRTRKGQAQLEPPQLKERFDTLQRGRTVDAEVDLRLPEFNTRGRSIVTATETSRGAPVTSPRITPVSITDTSRKQQEQVLQQRQQQVGTRSNLDVELDTPTLTDTRPTQQAGVRGFIETDTDQRGRQQQVPQLESLQEQQADTGLRLGFEKPTFQFNNPAERYRISRGGGPSRPTERTTPSSGAPIAFPDLDVGGTRTTSSTRDTGKTGKKSKGMLDLNVLEAIKTEQRFDEEAVTPTSKNIIQKFKKQEAGAGPIAALPSLQSLKGGEKRKDVKFF